MALFLAGLLAIMPLFFASRALFVGLAQTKDEKHKQIGRAAYPKEPIEVTEVFEHGEHHAVGETFSRSDSEWLQDFRIRAKNNSGKQIIFISWQLEFPETAATGNVMAFQSSYGISPFRKAKDYEKEGPIAAGDAFELGISPKKFEQLKAFVGQRHLLQSLTHADIRILDIHYSDGTGWSAGIATKRDPQNPDRYVPDLPTPGGA